MTIGGLRTSTYLILAVFPVLLHAPINGWAQCARSWLDGEGVAGTDRTVLTTLRVSEPQGDVLYVAGSQIQLAGTTFVNNIAKWDGNTWHAVGDPQISTIRALIEFNGQVIAGGLSTGGNTIAAWDGNQWTLMDGDPNGYNPSQIRELLVRDGVLYCAGGFFDPAETYIDGVFRWDGQSWSPIGLALDGYVAALAQTDDHLIAAGLFTSIDGVAASSIAAWDGNGWSPIGDLPANVRVRDVLSWSNEVYISTSVFIPIKGFSSGVYRWTGGDWQQVGSAEALDASALTVHNGTLFAAAASWNWSIDGVQTVSSVIRWDGAMWHPLGQTERNIRHLNVWQNQLLASGTFFSYDGPARHIATWDGTAWTALSDGMGYLVYGMHADDDSLLLYGGITRIGGVDVEGAARWDGQQFAEPFPLPGIVYENALVRYEGDYIVGTQGYDNTIGSYTYTIQRWDGAQWQMIDQGLGRGVFIFAEFAGELYIGGEFGVAPDTVTYMRVWDGVTLTDIPGPDQPVYALRVVGNALVVGGAFQTINGDDAHQLISNWTGTTWVPFPRRLHATIAVCTFNAATIKVIDEYQGELIVGGNFAGVARLAAAWNGTSWRQLGQSNVNPSACFNISEYHGGIYDFEIVDGRLFACGEITAPGAGRGVVRLQGNHWVAAADEITNAQGLAGVAYSLAGFDGDLWVAGNFTAVEDRVSVGYARLACTTRRGDLNCDGALTVSDIGPFVLALTNPDQYSIDYPDCDINNANINGDEGITVSDIGPFVTLLIGR